MKSIIDNINNLSSLTEKTGVGEVLAKMLVSSICMAMAVGGMLLCHRRRVSPGVTHWTEPVPKTVIENA